MKKSVLFFVAILFVGICNAQTTKPKMYAFAFVDTDDKKIGVGEVKNLARFDACMDKIGAQLGDYILWQDVLPFEGYECSKLSLLDWIENFKCGPDDVVIFAYMGHGSHSLGDTGTIFPQMCLGSTNDEDFVNLEWVKNQLMKKGPRLCIVLGDCCNSFDANTSVKSLGPDKSETSVSCASENAHVKALKKLFCESQGFVMAAGSKPGELSWINTNASDTSRAGFFMDAFIRAINSVSISSSNENLWDMVFNQVQQDPSLRKIIGNDGNAYMQHPIYKIDSKRVDVRNPIIIEDAPLIQALLSVGSDKISRTERKDNVDKVMRQYFAEGSLVTIVSQRGRNLERMYVKDYLAELSSKVFFRGAVIQSVKKNEQGKIISLSIHEIYEEKADVIDF